MNKLSWSNFKNGVCVVGYKNYDMMVDSLARKMVISSPHLNVYIAQSGSKNEGCQKILNHLMSSTLNKHSDIKYERVNVDNEDYGTAFQIFCFTMKEFINE